MFSSCHPRSHEVLKNVCSVCRAVEDLYFQSDNIPVPKEKTILDQARRGFGIESAGTRSKSWLNNLIATYVPNNFDIDVYIELGFAEWDRPLPPLPSASPYKGNLPFVATRWKITRPNEEERTRRRTLTTLQPLHLMVNPPPKMKGKIKVTENQGRIKVYIRVHCSTYINPSRILT